MERSEVEDGEEDMLILSTALTILSKKSITADKEWAFMFAVGLRTKGRLVGRR